MASQSPSHLQAGRREEGHCGPGCPEAARMAGRPGREKWTWGPGGITFILGHGWSRGLAATPTLTPAAAVVPAAIPPRGARGDAWSPAVASGRDRPIACAGESRDRDRALQRSALHAHGRQQMASHQLALLPPASNSAWVRPPPLLRRRGRRILPLLLKLRDRRSGSVRGTRRGRGHEQGGGGVREEMGGAQAS